MFDNTVLFPRNEDKVLQMENVINDSLNPKFENGRNSARLPQNSRILTQLSESNSDEEEDEHLECDKSSGSSDSWKSTEKESIDLNEKNISKRKSSSIDDDFDTQSENTEDNSYRSNAMSLDDCSFADEQQSENDESIMEQKSSNESDDDDDEDMKVMKNLAKMQNKRIVNNLAGGDCFFRSESVALYIQLRINSTEEAKIEKMKKKKKNVNRYMQAELEENIDQYIARMRSSHEWADGPILEATGREFRRQISVTLPCGQDYSLNLGQRLHIDLGFVNGNHYVTFVNHNKE
ncbi:MAG: hypothetical protein EZS28_017114 [Streblomastix strix]|uniref:OTU domain-containing protein n=1 Tax=Streblomastix strix TaxID=222440 RepID=A0A5J4VXM7_9EUKA|nr:MAG: hypothetical protein EZS28_017114 [Streblomastix strix]